MRDKSHDAAMAEAFRNDPSYAAELLSDILADGPSARPEFLITLRQIAKAFGGVPALAEAANLNPTSLYRMLSPSGNPTLESIINSLAGACHNLPHPERRRRVRQTHRRFPLVCPSTSSG